MLKERELVTDDEIVAGHSLHPPQAGQARALARRRAEGAASRRADRARDQQQSRVQAGRPVRAKNINPAHPHAAAALCARACRRDRARASAAMFFPTATRKAPAKTRNGSTPCASTAANCGAPDGDPTRDGLGRRLGAVSGAGMIDQSRRAPRHARSAEHPARCRRAGVPRAVGGAGLRHDAGTARARAVHLARMGGGARRRDQARARRPAIPTPARPIIRIGWRRWRNWSPRKA